MQCNIVIADGSVVIAASFCCSSVSTCGQILPQLPETRVIFERRFVFRGGKQLSEGVFQFVFRGFVVVQNR